MRILTVCSSYRVFGAEIITLKMLEGFRAAGHEQLAVTSIWTDGDFSGRLAAIGVEERRLPFGTFSKLLRPQPMWWTANAVVRLPWLWLAWRRIIREFLPDVVLFASTRLALPVVGLTNHCPCFVIEHSNQDVTATRRRVYGFLYPKLAGFIAVSRFTGSHLRKFGVPKERIHIIYNGVISERETALSNDSPGRRESHDGPMRIGIIGQVHPSKGHDLLVEACRLLEERHVAVEINVYGRGAQSYVESLKKRLEGFGLRNWHWMEYEPNQTRIYSAIDICVMPSATEAFGMVAAEASARQIPVIATRVGALPEVIEDGVTGFLINPGDAGELASRIEYLTRQPETARRFGISARQKIMRQFTQERMIREYEELFGMELLNRTARNA